MSWMEGVCGTLAMLRRVPNPFVAAAIVLLGVAGVPAHAQVRSVLQIRPEFASYAAAASARRSMPSQMKWGMIIGGVTGAAVGAILVSSRPCEAQGWGCLLRPVLVLGGAAAGGLVGMLVGGSIGKAIAEHAELDAAGARLRMGLRVPL